MSNLFARSLLSALLLTQLLACGGTPPGATPRPATASGSSDSGFTPSSPTPPAAGAAAPVLVFTAEAAEIVEGASVGLAWSTSGASLCTASGSWSGSRPLQGSLRLTPARGEHRYGLECLGDGGAVRREIVLTVRTLPVVVPEPETELNRVLELERGCCEATQ